MDYFSEFNDERLEAFLKTINLELFDLKKIDLDFLILKAKEHGFIETYELSNADISDKYFLTLAVMMCEFDAHKKFVTLPHQYQNLIKLKDLSLSTSAKEEVLNALYDLQNGVVDGGRKRRLVKRWEEDGKLELWQDFVHDLIIQFQSIATHNKENTNNFNFAKSLVEDRSKEGSTKHYKKRRTIKHKRLDIFNLIIYITCFVCCCVLLVALSKVNFRPYHLYLNLFSTETVGVIDSIKEESTKRNLRDDTTYYVYDVTYIKRDGYEDSGIFKEDANIHSKRVVGSQLDIVYDDDRVYEKTQFTKPFKALVFLSFLWCIFASILFFTKRLIIKHIISPIVRTTVYFTTVTVMLFVMTSFLIYQNRYEFYRYTAVASPTDFYQKRGRLYRIKDDMLFSGRVKEIDGDIIKIKSYKFGVADGLEVTYHGSMVKSIGVWNKGQRDGLFIDYANNGKIKTYVNYENGYKNGTTRFFEPQSGNLIFEGVYAYDQRVGCFRTYYESGSIQSQMLFKNGHLNGEAKVFYEDGRPKASVNFIHDKPSGFITYYGRDGSRSIKRVQELESTFSPMFKNDKSEFFNRCLLDLLRSDLKNSE